jgi:exodeoxyribonuclease V alpha subunit
VVHVRTAEGMVEHELDNAVALGLGWAITVHKSQGSEFPAVVVVLASCHGPMLQRRLLYTAMTRARRVVVVVGDRAAVARAVASDDAARRITRLAERLRAAK